MDRETYDHKMRLLAIYQDNLRELEKQLAQHGAYPPLQLINNLKYHRKNIDDLQIQLRTNAEEVTFDKLLVGLEDLRKFGREEARRAFAAYREAYSTQAGLPLAVMGIFSGGMLTTGGVESLYQKYIRSAPLDGSRDSISIIIYAIGALLSGAMAFGYGRFMTNRWHNYMVWKLGYDPFKGDDDPNE